MIRCRFYVPNVEDYRPVKWPYPHPFWCTGYTSTFAIIVAYADNQDQILEFWPDAVQLEPQPATEYVFSDRFPRPSWFKEGA